MSAVSHSKIYSQNETANTNNVLSIRQKDDHRQRQPAIFPKLYENLSRPDRKMYPPHAATRNSKDIPSNASLTLPHGFYMGFTAA